MAQSYFIPIGTQRTENLIVNSRFITTVGHVRNTNEVKAFLQQIRIEMPDAHHHVYAFRIGYGNSTLEGMSDDGEPSGTAGPPVLTVLRGSPIGDVIIVVTRYFGGTKLGTGGLVRAYTESAQIALQTLQTEEKIDKALLGIEAPYPYYEQIKRLIHEHHGSIEDETFTVNVAILTRFALIHIDPFTHALRELTAGQVIPIEF
ncbi:MAG: YigZ family protein [Anaerolineae bacterium]|jgi:uncharacterized YigZ family protein|nr:YigZ family protein [Anaerolineae bacterium]